MSKYSFLLPTRQYKEIGPYRLVKLGGLKRGEVIEISHIQRRSSRQMVAGLNLADKIAKAKNIPIEDALVALQTLGTSESAAIMAEFAEDLAQMMAGEQTKEELDAELVTIFMRSRAEAQLTEGTWTRLMDWSEEDTAELPEDLIAEVVAYIEAERSSDVEDESGNDSTQKKRKPQGSSETA